MKVWNGYGTEHSMNLVMVGRFRDAPTAETVKDIINQFTATLQAEEEAGRLTVGEPTDRFSDEILQLMNDVRVHGLRPGDLEQFLYDMKVRRDGAAVVITTDETDVQALLKVLLEKRARIEMYSAHDYPNTEYGRGK